MTSVTSRPIRCRFAPSPTGYLHLGGARTALFNYLFAKSMGGVHVLRIEDTDVERSLEDAVEGILQALEWLGISYDEGPYYQSKRLDVYQEYAKKLLSSGHAYPCSCTHERLEEVRERQRASNLKPQYDRLHRPNGLVPQSVTLPSKEDKESFVVRLRVPETGSVGFDDIVLGEMSNRCEEIDDFVILRSDGTPTYNFTVVVDDIEMQISHVIRGMDHVTNTFKQLVIYDCLNAPYPLFAHVPMILGADKKKLSKRHGATSVIDYKKDGYLPDAFVNYLARLGWSHGDKEIFTRQELETMFSLEHIGKSPAVFDFDKLLWVNAEHIKMTPAATLASHVAEILTAGGLAGDNLASDSRFIKLIESLKERTRTLVEMAKACNWFLVEESSFTIEPEAAEKHLKSAIKEPLCQLTEKLAALETFTEQSIETLFGEVVEEFQIKLGKLAQPVRVAVTGSSVSPPIYTVLEILGKEKTISRLKKTLATL